MSFWKGTFILGHPRKESKRLNIGQGKCICIDL